MTCNHCGDDRDTNRYGICEQCATAMKERARAQSTSSTSTPTESAGQQTIGDYL